MVLEMASVGQCDGVRCLFGLIFTFFPLATLFPLGHKAHGSKNGVPIL